MNVTPTITQFCHQTWQLNAQVQLTQVADDKCYIVTDKTPFHPVSHIWPDHPADKGSITINGCSHDVIDCLVGAVELTSNTLYVDKAIPVKRDQEGWVFVVVHVVETEEVVVSAGDSVELTVNKAYQQALSRGHSAGHLALLALNKILTVHGYWRKDAERKDPLGHYDFNNYAQETSTVSQNHCLDTYRLGKTLRKRGLNSGDVISDLDKIENLINQQVNEWLVSASAVTMQCDGEHLTDSRYWRCDLSSDESVVIPCGGTHVDSLTEITKIIITLREVEANYIEMQTDVN